MDDRYKLISDDRNFWSEINDFVYKNVIFEIYIFLEIFGNVRYLYAHRVTETILEAIK